MTHNRKKQSNNALQPTVQPTVANEDLFNLMLSMQARGQLFMVLDECENQFDHRDIHTLDLEEQRRLYEIARDEIAKRRMKNLWHFSNGAKRYLQ